MSVIPESLAGDEIVCLAEFAGPRHGQPVSRDSSRTFRIGERVHFVGWYEDKHARDNPACFMVVFDASDGKRYEAAQTYFATPECWEELRKHFARPRKGQPPRKAKAPAGRRSTRKTRAAVSSSKKRRSA